MMHDFERHVGKSLDRDDCDLFIKPGRQTFSHYWWFLGRVSNPGYQIGVLNTKRSQFVVKIISYVCCVLCAIHVEALGHVKLKVFILLNHIN